jgi:hypothetical protein
MSQGEMDELVALIRQRVKSAPAGKPALRIVGAGGRTEPPTKRLDDVERESRIRWIQALAKAYRPQGLELIVKQALSGKRYMSDLTDDEILELHRNIDRARECMVDGITFEEAGLLRSHGEVA